VFFGLSEHVGGVMTQDSLGVDIGYTRQVVQRAFQFRHQRRRTRTDLGDNFWNNPVWLSQKRCQEMHRLNHIMISIRSDGL
jgi:hypothetical protein